MPEKCKQKNSCKGKENNESDVEVNIESAICGI